ncbi:inositol 3-kinase [Olea europaea subsp. europaea]|uniref:Inositol 3-kinase n=1 Tax=Olea europaea subsp. europaea TaxID=158383 RepID=A0A8S0SMG7_OLEEU|nr:inositol 3-kinase [Olea europaea subsp. europaea]
MIENRGLSCLIVGNYCHDVLIKDGTVIGKSLGGAASFISGVLDGFSISSTYVSKVGIDFSYPVIHQPLICPSSKTTIFHAHFSSEIKRKDRVLKRVCTCDPITPDDLPNSHFSFGLAVGVGGEILPETLEKMLGICDIVFVDIQALIRVFDSVDGTVMLVDLRETGFYRLLPRIRFLKASADESPYVDIEEVRKYCCVVVTNGKEGCTLYEKDKAQQIAPFPTVQVDPTGAGDSFLGGLAAGLVQGLGVPEAALLGNFLGSLTVGEIGLPNFDLKLLQRVKDEVQQRLLQCTGCPESENGELMFMKSFDHEQFHVALGAAKLTCTHPIQECPRDLPRLHAAEQSIHSQCSGRQKSLSSTFYEEVIKSSDDILGQN